MQQQRRHVRRRPRRQAVATSTTTISSAVVYAWWGRGRPSRPQAERRHRRPPRSEGESATDRNRPERADQDPSDQLPTSEAEDRAMELLWVLIKAEAHFRDNGPS